MSLTCVDLSPSATTQKPPSHLLQWKFVDKLPALSLTPMPILPLLELGLSAKKQQQQQQQHHHCSDCELGLERVDQFEAFSLSVATKFLRVKGFAFLVTSTSLMCLAHTLLYDKKGLGSVLVLVGRFIKSFSFSSVLCMQSRNRFPGRENRVSLRNSTLPPIH